MVFPLIGAIASIGSALIGAGAASSAAKQQAKATRYAADVTARTADANRALLEPSIRAGDTARGFQLGALGLPGGVSRDEAMAAFRTSPGYSFAFDEGRNALEGSAATNRTLFSGKTMKDLTRFGQGLADQSFGNWFGRVGAIAGQGAGATGTAVNVNADSGRTLADLAVQGGNNRASSYITGANALTGGIQNFADMYSYYNPPSWQRPSFAGGVNIGNGWFQ